MKSVLEKRLKATNPNDPSRSNAIIDICEHEDAPGEFVVSITKGGLDESIFGPEEIVEIGQILADFRRFAR